jgi:hypothetical protein
MAVSPTTFNVTVTVPLSPFFLIKLMLITSALLKTLNEMFSNSNCPAIAETIITNISVGKILLRNCIYNMIKSNYSNLGM